MEEFQIYNNFLTFFKSKYQFSRLIDGLTISFLYLFQCLTWPHTIVYGLLECQTVAFAVLLLKFVSILSIRIQIAFRPNTITIIHLGSQLSTTSLNNNYFNHFIEICDHALWYNMVLFFFGNYIKKTKPNIPSHLYIVYTTFVLVFTIYHDLFFNCCKYSRCNCAEIIH